MTAHAAATPPGASPPAAADTLAPPTQTLRRRVAEQGGLLFAGYAAAQGFSFARNALVGYALSKGDFGIAATITLILQLVETLSDVGTDRLIVQAEDGHSERLVGMAHTVLIARGVLTALILYIAAHPAASFFAIPQVAWALEIAALVPLVRSFLHLDFRRAQRRLDNRPQLLVEVIPQAVALAATVPLLAHHGGYAVALLLALIQAATSVMISHAIAERPYRLAADRALIVRFCTFGWPIWLSAFPLIAVYQGDRVIVGRLLGMEELAAFSAAFMVTMVPGLVAAKVGNSLMLPVLAAARDDAQAFARRYQRLGEITLLAAAVYVLVFVAAGGTILPLAFGPNYDGLGTVIAWLAAMWGLRMIQAVPGMALMALGETRPFLGAGLIRATALLPSLLVAANGYGLAAVAAAGVAGEAASLVYVAWRLDALRPGMLRPLLLPTLALAPAAALGLVLTLR